MIKASLYNTKNMVQYKIIHIQINISPSPELQLYYIVPSIYRHQAWALSISSPILSQYSESIPLNPTNFCYAFCMLPIAECSSGRTTVLHFFNKAMLIWTQGMKTFINWSICFSSLLIPFFTISHSWEQR